MSFAARPDWHSPLPIAQRAAYAAYDQPGRFLLPPQALAAGRVEGGSPLRLDIVQQNRASADGSGALARYSILSLAFAADFALDAARQAAFDLGQRVQLAPLAVEGGWLRLNAVQALDLPPALDELLPLDAASLSALNLAVRLDSAGTDLFVAALQRGLLAVGASAWLRVRGVAERVPLSLSFDPAGLLAAVRALSGGGDEIDVAVLRQRLIDAPHLLALGLPERSAQAPASLIADAVIDRIAARFATPRPSPADAPLGVRLAFDPAAMAAGRVQWNLADALLAPRLLTLDADPLGPLRTLPAGDLLDAVVRRFDARALASGWRSLSVRANLPERRIGVMTAQVDVQVPARPPARMSTLKASAPLAASDKPVSLDLRLSPSEPLAYQWQASAVVLSEGRAETLKGPLRSGDREHLLVGPDDFGLRLLPVEAEPALLRQAEVEVECFGTRKGKPWSARGTLDAARPELAFAVPFDVDDAQIRALARALDDGAQRAMAPQPADGLRLDAFSFDGSGSRELALSCEFDDDARQCAIEIAPEDGIDDPLRRKPITFTRARPQQDWGWLALSPFRSGYRWRWNAQAPWSPVLQPDAPLRLRSSRAGAATTGPTDAHQQGKDRMNTDKDETHAHDPGAGDLGGDEGYEQVQGVWVAQDADGGWRYRPGAPGLARGADGRAQFTLVGAGAITLLALTASWGVTADELDAVRSALAARAPAGAARPTLTPAPLEVGAVRLLLSDGHGGFEELAKAQSSGVPPYQTAFNVMLSAAQAERVRKALGGERGLLELHYEAREAPRSRRSAHAQVEESLAVDASVRDGQGEAGLSARMGYSERVEADSGRDEPREPQSYAADAADWGLPKP